MKIKRQIILNLKEFTSSHCTRKLEISRNLIVYKCFSIEVLPKLTAILKFTLYYQKEMLKLKESFMKYQ